MRAPLLISEALERPLALRSAAEGTPYLREIVSRLSPCPTTIGEPPAAVHPLAEPATAGPSVAAEGRGEADATPVAGGRGEEDTPPADAAPAEDARSEEHTSELQ